MVEIYRRHSENTLSVFMYLLSPLSIYTHSLYFHLFIISLVDPGPIFFVSSLSLVFYLQVFHDKR